MIKKFLLIMLNMPIIILSKIIRRDKKVWVFGAWFGKKFTDNSKYLFEYVNKNCPDIKAIWLTTDYKTLRMVRANGYTAYATYSILGYFYSCIAKYGFISCASPDLNEYTFSNMRIINLWHGIPLKKIMNDNKFLELNKPINNPIIKNIKEFLFNVRSMVFYTTIATCDTYEKIYKRAFAGYTERVDVIGQPRCDSFFLDIKKTPFTENLKKYKDNNLKIGIYMPTCRKGYLFIKFWQYFYKEIDNLNRQLKSMDIVLLIKLHYYHLKDVKKIKKEYSNLIFVKDEDINQDIYSILPLTDFLITDYSSIFYDYLFMDKPVLFFPFDKKEYLKEDDEMYFDYDEVTPGEKAHDWNEFYKKLKIISSGIDNFEQERKVINDKINKYHDGHICERIVEWIKSLD